MVQISVGFTALVIYSLKTDRNEENVLEERHENLHGCSNDMQKSTNIHSDFPSVGFFSIMKPSATETQTSRRSPLDGQN